MTLRPMRYNAPVQRLSEATAIEQYPRLKREEHRNDPLQNGDRTMTHRDVLDVTTRVASRAATASICKKRCLA